MSAAFVLGNGVSRLNADLSLLKKSGTVIGCNAIYRDFIPDHLVAVDYKMIKELVENKVYEKTLIWSNKSDANNFPEINYFTTPLGWSSGPTALQLACLSGHRWVFLLGFDYQGCKNNTVVNNVYAGTKNYKKRSDPPTYYGNWLAQTYNTIKQYPEVEFIRVVTDHSQFIPNWPALTNLQHITYDEFNSGLQK